MYGGFEVDLSVESYTNKVYKQGVEAIGIIVQGLEEAIRSTQEN